MKIPDLEQLKKMDFSEMLSEKFRRKPDGRIMIYLFFKRLLDILVSAFALIFLLPVFLLVIILIHLESPGKAVFSQQRVGLHGKIFRIFKFRSMHKDVKHEDYAPREATDTRITRVGRFLRRTSLDELPQFWNVLKGNMTLVGPRPEMKFIVDTYSDLQKLRLTVKPGLTGLWQIYGRKDQPLHQNIEYDLWYIMHSSFWLDLETIFKTFYVVIGGRKTYKKNF